MSLEEVRTDESLVSRERPKDKVDELLERLPLELQEVWEAKIDALKTEEEQIAVLEEVLEKREQKEQIQPSQNELLPEGVEIFERFPDEVKELLTRLEDSGQKIEIGYGQAAHVVAAEGQEGLCYKVLLPHEVQPVGTNDIARETDLQQKAYLELDGIGGVRVPAIFGFIHEDGTRAMIMELLNAVSVRQVIEEKREDLPDTFDLNCFVSALQEFVDAMHTKGMYHRDLHAGNVLIDRDTGRPCVIDFGFATDTVVDEDEAYILRTVSNGQEDNRVLLSDKGAVKMIRQQIIEYRNEHRGV